MVNKEVLVEKIEKVLEVYDIFNYTSLEDIEQFYYKLEEELLITFSVYGRSTLEGDCWLQTEYFSHSIGYPIILDYNTRDCYETVDDIVGYIENINAQIDLLESAKNPEGGN